MCSSDLFDTFAIVKNASAVRRALPFMVDGEIKAFALNDEVLAYTDVYKRQGGQGSRLGALTQKIATPAVSFGGKFRIIDFSLSNCSNSGIDTVGVLTQYRPYPVSYTHLDVYKRQVIVQITLLNKFRARTILNHTRIIVGVFTNCLLYTSRIWHRRWRRSC